MTSSITIRMQQTGKKKKLLRSQRLCTASAMISTREVQINNGFSSPQKMLVTSVKSMPEVRLNKTAKYNTIGVFDGAVCFGLADGSDGGVSSLSW